MNPSNNQAAGPTPVEEQTSVLPLPELSPQNATIPTAPDPGQVPATQAPQVSPINIVPLPVQTASPQGVATVNQTVGFQVADDKDVIEPEWVHKAKAIVNNTSDDPYKQSEDLTVLKADYMQKRYNKIVKLK